MHKPNLFTLKVHARTSTYVDTQKLGSPRIQTYRNIYKVYTIIYVTDT